MPRPASNGRNASAPGFSRSQIFGSSAREFCTVSTLSARLVPMMPVGPRLSHPVTYKPRHVSAPSTTRPLECGAVPRELVERQPGNGNAAITDTSEDEPAGKFDLLFGWPRNLRKRRPFQKVARQNYLFHAAVADEGRRAQKEPKPDGAPSESRFPGGECAKKRQISGTANVASMRELGFALRIERQFGGVNQRTAIHDLSQFAQLLCGELGLDWPSPPPIT